MELKNYIQVLHRGWWLIVPALLIAVISGLVFNYSQTPAYRTSATFVVSPSASAGEFNEFMTSLNMLSKRDGVMATYVEIATSKSVLDAVYDALGLTQAQIDNLDVRGELIPSTNVMEIIVESRNPLLAQKVADLVGQQTIEYVKTLYEPYDMKPLDPAFVPQLPAKPHSVRNLLLAALLGFSVGVGAAFLLENLQSKEETIAPANIIIDGDTGIYNRNYFMQRLGEEMSRAKRHDYPLSMALMNIEHLDMVGNMHQPRLRTEALRRVALFLKQYLREEDLVARFEGDRLALLLPDTPGADAKGTVEKLQTRLEWNVFEFEESGVKLNLTATSGVAAYVYNGTGRDEFLNHAEDALQHAGDNGHDKIHLFDDGQDSAVDDERDVHQRDSTTEM